jgi:hypothetical protein
MWNYRLVQWQDEGEDQEFIELREVYYDAKGLPVGHSSATISGNTIKELHDVQDMMASAFTKPILKSIHFVGKYEEVPTIKID